MNLLAQLEAATTSGKRLCSKCKVWKPRAEFTIKNKLKGWLDTRCNACKRHDCLRRWHERKVVDKGFN